MPKCAVFAFHYKGFVSLQAQPKVQNRIFTQNKTKQKQCTHCTKIQVTLFFLLLSGGKIKKKQMEIVKRWEQVKAPNVKLKFTFK